MSDDFFETGDGPALLFLPGSYSTASAWKSVHAALRGRYRLISTSLPGYGPARDPRSHEDADYRHITSWLAGVADRIGTAFHLIGHSFGGLISIAACFEATVKPQSLLTFEGNPVYVRTGVADVAWRKDADQACTDFFSAWQAGAPDAPRHIIDFWGQSGVWDTMPEPVQAFCRNKVETNVLDWKSAISFAPELADLARITVPTTFARGALANQAMIQTTKLLVDTLPDAREATVDGAGHFLISTHPEACAAIVDQHMARVAS